MLYPQAAKSIFHSNPNACFDWWGYTNKEFAFKTSEVRANSEREAVAVSDNVTAMHSN